MIADNSYPCLILNADYRPLSVHPLSVLPWKQAVKKVVLGRIAPVAEYDVSIADNRIRLPSVVMLRRYVNLRRGVRLSRLNVWLRDGGRCVYCRNPLSTSEVTFDHVVPRSRGGGTSLANVSSACAECNLRKADRTPQEAGMPPDPWPFVPTQVDLAKAEVRLGRSMPTPRDWVDYLYWAGDLDTS